MGGESIILEATHKKRQRSDICPEGVTLVGRHVPENRAPKTSAAKKMGKSFNGSITYKRFDQKKGACEMRHFYRATTGQLTASFSALPALNAGTLAAEI